MAVVIRLQGLSVTAGTEDIRKFFTGLRIPDGGVHIIGGEREEAFIIFASDEDARRAMTRSQGCIKGSTVTLLLSSKTEMQNVLERSTKNAELDQKRRLEDNPRRAGRSVDREVSRRSLGRSDHPPALQPLGDPGSNEDLFLFLKGLPFSVTEQEIHEFFSGIAVDGVILFKTAYGANNGKGIAKFFTSQDTYEGLKRHKKYIGSRYVELSLTTADDWRRAGGNLPMAGNIDKSFVRERSPILYQRNSRHHDRSQSPKVSTDDEYCVLLENLPFEIEKEDIKRLFCNANLEDGQILHLLGSDGRRTRSTFVLFRSLRDYCDALSNEKRMLKNRWVYTRPISREKMIALLESQGMDESEKIQQRPQSYPNDAYDSEKCCLLVRNLPFDVRKVEIMDLFLGFDITEDRVFIMRDHNEDGVGKALVLLQSEAEAMSALSLDGQRFLGSEVILKCISRSQMQQFGYQPAMMQEQMMQNPQPREEQYSGRSGMASYHPLDVEYPNFRGSSDGDLQMAYAPAQVQGGSHFESYAGPPQGPQGPQDSGNGFRGGFDAPVQSFDGSTCVQLLNLPFQIKREEIYDFCYGYQIIPGSVSLQYEPSGRPKGSATAVFESRQEALRAIDELSGRPIGPRRIQLVLV